MAPIPLRTFGLLPKFGALMRSWVDPEFDMGLWFAGFCDSDFVAGL